MSYNRNVVLEEEYTEENAQNQQYGHHEAYVPQGVRTNRNGSPMVSGQPPVLIRNSEIMDQLYLMGDEFKEFHSTMRTFNARLSAVEERTGGSKEADQERGDWASGRRPGKEPIRENIMDRGNPEQEQRFRMVTPRRLDFGGTEPIVEFPREGSQRMPEPVQENRMVIHPNASGHPLGDRPQGEDNLGSNRGILAGLQDRLEVGLTPEELRKLYDDLERDSTMRARPLPGRAPSQGYRGGRFGGRNPGRTYRFGDFPNPGFRGRGYNGGRRGGRAIFPREERNYQFAGQGTRVAPWEEVSNERPALSRSVNSGRRDDVTPGQIVPQVPTAPPASDRASASSPCLSLRPCLNLRPCLKFSLCLSLHPKHKTKLPCKPPRR